jgi:hypothetical protein
VFGQLRYPSLTPLQGWCFRPQTQGSAPLHPGLNISHAFGVLNQKPKPDLTTDYADYTDTIGYDYQCPEVLPRKDCCAHPDNIFKICEIGGICG